MELQEKKKYRSCSLDRVRRGILPPDLDKKFMEYVAESKKSQSEVIVEALRLKFPSKK